MRRLPLLLIAVITSTIIMIGCAVEITGDLLVVLGGRKSQRRLKYHRHQLIFVFVLVGFIQQCNPSVLG